MIQEEEIGATVRELMSAILDRPIAAGEDVSRDNEPTWDSLHHVELLLSVEGALNVRFHEEELPVLTSLDKLVQSVKQHLAA